MTRNEKKKWLNNFWRHPDIIRTCSTGINMYTFYFPSTFKNEAYIEFFQDIPDEYEESTTGENYFRQVVDQCVYSVKRFDTGYVFTKKQLQFVLKCLEQKYIFLSDLKIEYKDNERIWYVSRMRRRI